MASKCARENRPQWHTQWHRGKCHMSDSRHIIFHIDVNSAFLSWSAIKLLQEGGKQDLRQIPSIVGGDQSTRHGIVVAKSIPAKKYGIKTADTVASAFQRCPELVSVPPDHAWYREQSRALMTYLSEVCPVIEQVSIDECYMDYGPISGKYESPEAAAHFIKDSVRERFGFTVNIGVSDRKVLAKMASDFQKPDRVHTLYVREIPEKMWPLPVAELYMCGKSSSGRLMQLGIRTIGDLAKMDPAVIESMMKSHGKMLWRFANGMDNSVVEPVRDRAKGVGNSTTLAENVTDREMAYKVLRDLSRSVAGRLQKKHFLAGALCVEIKYSDFRSESHQKQLKRETADPDRLYRESCRLFDQLWNREPIRLLGVRTTKLVDVGEPRQMNLFEYQEQLQEQEKQKKADRKQKQLDQALEKIRDKFGEGAIRKGI